MRIFFGKVQFVEHNYHPLAVILWSARRQHKPAHPQLPENLPENFGQLLLAGMWLDIILFTSLHFPNFPNN